MMMMRTNSSSSTININNKISIVKTENAKKLKNVNVSDASPLKKKKIVESKKQIVNANVNVNRENVSKKKKQQDNNNNDNKKRKKRQKKKNIKDNSNNNKNSKDNNNNNNNNNVKPPLQSSFQLLNVIRLLTQILKINSLPCSLLNFCNNC
jgi:hypothetical protein